MKTKKQTTQEFVYVERGSMNTVQARNGQIFELKYLGGGMHIFFRNSGGNIFYEADLWNMSPDNRYVKTNKRGLIPVKKLDIKINSPQLKDLIRKVRRL